MPSNLKQDVEEAIKDMVITVRFDKGYIVSLPLMYPSGARACVLVGRGSSQESFLVSDGGKGLDEAHGAGVTEDDYLQAAKSVGDAAGLNSYMGVIALLAPKHKLQGAIITVANASLKAVDRAINTKG